MKLVAILACLSLVSSVPVGAKETYPHDEAAIVRVDCDQSVGTAVKVGPNTYLTAAHVVDEGVCKVDGQEIVVTSIDKNIDFATFTGPASNSQLPIDCRGFIPKELYLSRGYAYGGLADFEEMMVASSYKVRGTHFIALVGEIIPGMSGGPLINEAGKVVGINNIKNPSASLPLSVTPVCKGGK